MKTFVRFYLPVALWAALMTLFSTAAFGGAATYEWLDALARAVAPDVSKTTLALLHGAARKMAHVTEYFIFGLLIWRAVRQEAAEPWRARWALWTLAIAAGFAALDEFHQLFERGRVGSLADVGFDALGAALALTTLRLRAAAKAQEESA